MRFHTYQDLLIRYENDNNTETQHDSARKAKIVKNTIRAEDIRANFRRIRMAVKPNDQPTGGLNSVMIPKDTMSPTGHPDDIYDYLDNTTANEVRWETVLERSAIEHHLLAYNKKSFRAASTSPCGHGILLDSLTFTTASPAGRQFMQGILPPTWYSDNDLLREFLGSFFAPAITTNNEPISTEISKEDVQLVMFFGVPSFSYVLLLFVAFPFTLTNVKSTTDYCHYSKFHVYGCRHIESSKLYWQTFVVPVIPYKGAFRHSIAYLVDKRNFGSEVAVRSIFVPREREIEAHSYRDEAVELPNGPTAYDEFVNV
jgi:hypothetical protein